MRRAWRRALLLAAAVLVALRLLRVPWTVAYTLLHNRPLRIGNWFRIPEARHREVYGSVRRYDVERQRALEEGWRVVSEERTPKGVAVLYERTEPALGWDRIEPSKAEDVRK